MRGAVAYGGSTALLAPFSTTLSSPRPPAGRRSATRETPFTSASSAPSLGRPCSFSAGQCSSTRSWRLSGCTCWSLWPKRTFSGETTPSLMPVRACVRVCVCACVYACVRVCVCVQRRMRMRMRRSSAVGAVPNVACSAPPPVRPSPRVEYCRRVPRWLPSPSKMSAEE